MPPLNPQMAEILALPEAAMRDRLERVMLSPVEARAQMNATFEAFWDADRPTLWAVYSDEIRGPKGAVRVRPACCSSISGWSWASSPSSACWRSLPHFDPCDCPRGRGAGASRPTHWGGGDSATQLPVRELLEIARGLLLL
jgi:hypothetical protein